MQLNTIDLCNLLGITRNWVTAHLRYLSHSNAVAGKNRILYEEEDILNFFNETATFSRQTRMIDITEYVKAEEYEKILDTISHVCVYSRSTALKKYLMSIGIHNPIVPQEEKRRGGYPWVEAPLKLRSLSEMKTLKQLMARENLHSTEAAYRYVFRNGMIRVSIEGRSWYVQPSNPEHGILVPA